MEEPHLKVSVGGGNSCKKGETCEWQERTNAQRKRKQKQIFLNSKLTSKIGFEQTLNCKRTTVILRLREQECGEIQLKNQKGRTTFGKINFFVFKTDFQNRFWTGSRLQQIHGLIKTSCENDRKKNENKMVRGFFLGSFNSSRFQKSAWAGAQSEMRRRWRATTYKRGKIIFLMFLCLFVTQYRLLNSSLTWRLTAREHLWLLWARR